MEELWLALLLLRNASVCKHSLTNIAMLISLSCTFLFIAVRHIDGLAP
jgi:hypothetical protein